MDCTRENHYKRVLRKELTKICTFKKMHTENVCEYRCRHFYDNKYWKFRMVLLRHSKQAAQSISMVATS